MQVDMIERDPNPPEVVEKPEPDIDAAYESQRDIALDAPRLRPRKNISLAALEIVAIAESSPSSYEDRPVLMGLAASIDEADRSNHPRVAEFLRLVRWRRLDRIANRGVTDEQADIVISAVNRGASMAGQVRLDAMADTHPLADECES